MMHALLILGALYWNAGVRTSKPTVCFAGDAMTSRKDRVDEIKTWMTHFEQAANIRFQYKNECTKEGDLWTDDIRIALDNTSAPGITGDLFDQVSPVPGTGCPLSQGTGGWGRSPDEYASQKPCMFNVHLGDDGPDATTRYMNHTLHEIGHALGLDHEHARFDVPKEWVIKYLDEIPNIDAAEAETLYNAGERSVKGIVDRPIATLQKISGFETVEKATQLRNDAKTAFDNGTPSFGGAATSSLTPYDRWSVMHYSWAGMQTFAPGNYAQTGLSSHDRLALRILYPEDVRVAELIGTRVLKVGQTLKLASGWEAAGATMPNVAKDFAWKLDGTTISSGTSVSKPMPSPGTFTLSLTHKDFLGRDYSYTGQVKVMTPEEFVKKVIAPLL